jgi:uncharacterized protein
MMKLRFEWDEVKAQSNAAKHKISFETAARVFADPFLIIEQDRIEGGEQRWQALGVVEGFVLLLVAHTFLEGDHDTDIIRIISARKADKRERRRYEQERR